MPRTKHVESTEKRFLEFQLKPQINSFGGPNALDPFCSWRGVIVGTLWPGFAWRTGEPRQQPDARVALRGRRLLYDRRVNSRYLAFSTRPTQRLQHEGFDRRRTGRRARRGGRSLHHLRLSFGRHTDVRDATRLRRRANRQRALFDVAASAKDVAESVVVYRIRARGVGRCPGALLQTTIVVRWQTDLRVSPFEVSKHEGDLK